MTTRNLDMHKNSKVESASKCINQPILKTHKKNSNNNLISIVIPVYNEENTIADVISRIPNHRKYEIIIVDDGSTDNTIRNIKNISNERVRLFRHKNNYGYGAALLTGLKHSRGEILVTMDSDGQHSPEEITNLIHPILQDKADIVIGSRYLGECRFKVPLSTRVGEFVIKKTLWLLYNQNVSNSQNGFRAYNQKALHLLKKVRSRGMGFSTAVLFELASNKLKVIEVPMTAYPRKYGTSYVNLIKVFKSISFCIFSHLLRKLKFNTHRFFKI